MQWLIWRVRTPIRSILNPFRYVVSLIVHIPSYPLYRSHLHPLSLFHVHNFSIIPEQKVKLSLSITPCHDHEFTLSTSYTKSLHTPSSSVHQLQHLPKLDCLTFILPSTSWPLHCNGSNCPGPGNLHSMELACDKPYISSDNFTDMSTSTIIPIHVWNSIPITTVCRTMGPNAGISVLTQLSLFSINRYILLTGLWVDKFLPLRLIHDLM